MAEVATPSGTREEREARAERHHSLAGVYGLGIFLVGHLVVQASALGGEGRYTTTVVAIRPWLTGIVDVLVLAALVVHVGHGLRFLRAAPSDARLDRFGDRRLSVAQRMSAVLVLVFVLVHLFELRLQRLFFGLEPAGLFTALSAQLSWTWAGVPWKALFYVIGIAATSFHFANGLFAATAARGRSRALTVILGVVLFGLGTLTTIGIATGTRLLPPAGADSAPPCGAPAAKTPVAAPSR
jgi:succinate dehydrogenase/fumarate reductase cytochrome b subunit